MMIWVDLRQFLEAPTWEAEQKLWHRLADEQRVILTPGGQACVLHGTETVHSRLGGGHRLLPVPCHIVKMLVQ